MPDKSRISAVIDGAVRRSRGAVRGDGPGAPARRVKQSLGWRDHDVGLVRVVIYDGYAPDVFRVCRTLQQPLKNEVHMGDSSTLASFVHADAVAHALGTKYATLITISSGKCAVIGSGRRSACRGRATDEVLCQYRG